MVKVSMFHQPRPIMEIGLNTKGTDKGQKSTQMALLKDKNTLANGNMICDKDKGR